MAAIEEFRWPEVDAFLKAVGKLTPEQWKTVHRRTRRAEPQFRWIFETRQVALARMRAKVAPSKAAEKRLTDAFDHYEDIATDIRALQAHDSRKRAVEFVMTLRFAVDEVVLAHTMKPWLEETRAGHDALVVLYGLFDGVVPAVVLPYPSNEASVAESSPPRARAANREVPKHARGAVPPDEWLASWRAIGKRVRAHGGTASRVVVGKRATEASVRSIEKQLGTPIPVSLREIVRTLASRARFEWKLPDEHSEVRAEYAHTTGFAPPAFGMVAWDLAHLPRLENERQAWEDISSSNSSLRVWRNKMPFLALSNGDLLAVDTRTGSVVYLDHDEGPMHGRRLGKSFASFIGVFTALGCPGPESWELAPFLAASGLTAASVSAGSWIAWLQMPE